MTQAWEGLNARELAAALDCSEEAARVRLHRARRRLAIALEAPAHAPPGGGRGHTDRNLNLIAGDAND